MSDVAIKFENVSKQYRLGLVSTRTLSHDLKRWWITNVLGKEDPYFTIGKQLLINGPYLTESLYSRKSGQAKENLARRLLVR